MYRKNIAVLFGGHSTEYDVSLQSAAAVLPHFPGDRYKVFSIGIIRDGDWYHYTGAVSNIAEGRWCEEAACLHPVVFSQNRSVGGFLERHDGGHTVQKLDLALPVLHGKNGEDALCRAFWSWRPNPAASAMNCSAAWGRDCRWWCSRNESPALQKSFRLTVFSASRIFVFYNLTRILQKETFPFYIPPVS